MEYTSSPKQVSLVGFGSSNTTGTYVTFIGGKSKQVLLKDCQHSAVMRITQSEDVILLGPMWLLNFHGGDYF